jgi:hypothetical protein
MIRKPFKTEWDTSHLSSERRDYLDTNLSFEEIANRIHAEFEIIAKTVEPYRDHPPGEAREAKKARQGIFLISVSPKTCDLFYNAPDGLRARYWQSPDHGCVATKHLIGQLLPLLIAEKNPATCDPKVVPMTRDDIEASLVAPSAKIWLRERDDNQDSLLFDDQLLVPRWKENEQHAHVNIGFWRRSPLGGELEIKGALIGLDKTEYLPPCKRDRSCQIFRFGFT